MKRRPQRIVPERAKDGPRGSAAFGNSRISASRHVLPSARETFEQLRPVLLASRPSRMVPHPYWRDRKGKPVMVTVYGRPTYRNVMENGQLR